MPNNDRMLPDLSLAHRCHSLAGGTTTWPPTGRTRDASLPEFLLPLTLSGGVTYQCGYPNGGGTEYDPIEQVAGSVAPST